MVCIVSEAKKITYISKSVPDQFTSIGVGSDFVQRESERIYKISQVKF